MAAPSRLSWLRQKALPMVALSRLSGKCPVPSGFLNVALAHSRLLQEEDAQASARAINSRS